MRKAKVTRPLPDAVESPNAIEGQITEICRELELEAKRLQRLQEQAAELLAVIRQWAVKAEPSQG